MNISATFIGELIFYVFIVFVLVVGFLSFYLGKRKTHTPKIAMFIGILLSLIPPLGLIYIVVLVLKNDIKQASLEVVG